jgi:hypothetical protein
VAKYPYKDRYGDPEYTLSPIDLDRMSGRLSANPDAMNGAQPQTPPLANVSSPADDDDEAVGSR